jgi:hypothetical protein
MWMRAFGALCLLSLVCISFHHFLASEGNYPTTLYATRNAGTGGMLRNMRPRPSLNMGDLPIPFSDDYPYDDRGVIPGSNNHLFGNEGRLPPPSMDDFSSPPWTPARAPRRRTMQRGLRVPVSSLGFGSPDLPIPISDDNQYDSRGPIPGSNVYFYGPYQGRFPPTVVDDYPSPPWDYGSAPSLDDPNY